MQGLGQCGCLGAGGGSWNPWDIQQVCALAPFIGFLADASRQNFWIAGANGGACSVVVPDQVYVTIHETATGPGGVPMVDSKYGFDAYGRKYGAAFFPQVLASGSWIQSQVFDPYSLPNLPSGSWTDVATFSGLSWQRVWTLTPYDGAPALTWTATAVLESPVTLEMSAAAATALLGPIQFGVIGPSGSYGGLSLYWSGTPGTVSSITVIKTPGGLVYSAGAPAPGPGFTVFAANGVCKGNLSTTTFAMSPTDNVPCVMSVKSFLRVNLANQLNSRITWLYNSALPPDYQGPVPLYYVPAGLTGNFLQTIIPSVLAPGEYTLGPSDVGGVGMIVLSILPAPPLVNAPVPPTPNAPGAGDSIGAGESLGAGD